MSMGMFLGNLTQDKGFVCKEISTPLPPDVIRKNDRLYVKSETGEKEITEAEELSLNDFLNGQENS